MTKRDIAWHDFDEARREMLCKWAIVLSVEFDAERCNEAQEMTASGMDQMACLFHG